jgi:hypothetical protein
MRKEGCQLPLRRKATEVREVMPDEQDHRHCHRPGFGFVAERITEDVLSDLGVDPRLVRVAGGVVGAIVS